MDDRPDRPEDDASAGRECYDAGQLHNSASIIVFGVLLVIVLMFGCVGTKKLLAKQDMHRSLKCLFYTSFAATTTVLLSSIAGSLTCIYALPVPFFITSYMVCLASMLLLFSCILGTLLVRLVITFKESIYSISKRTKRAFIVLSSIFALISTASLPLFCLFLLTDDGLLFYLFIDLVAVGALFYVGTASWAVYIFSHNLLQLAKMRLRNQKKQRSCSEQSISTHTSAPNVYTHKLHPSTHRPVSQRTLVALKQRAALNDSQRKLVRMTSKYISLFVAAVASSAISALVSFLSDHLNFQVPVMVVAVDCTVNFVFLFLQYSFASETYQRCCPKLDFCCKRLMTQNMMRSIEEHSRDHGRESALGHSVGHIGVHSRSLQPSPTSGPTTPHMMGGDGRHTPMPSTLGLPASATSQHERHPLPVTPRSVMGAPQRSGSPEPSIAEQPELEAEAITPRSSAMSSGFTFPKAEIGYRNTSIALTKVDTDSVVLNERFN